MTFQDDGEKQQKPMRN